MLLTSCILVMRLPNRFYYTWRFFFNILALLFVRRFSFYENFLFYYVFFSIDPFRIFFYKICTPKSPSLGGAYHKTFIIALFFLTAAVTATASIVKIQFDFFIAIWTDEFLILQHIFIDIDFFFAIRTG